MLSRLFFFVFLPCSFLGSCSSKGDRTGAQDSHTESFVTDEHGAIVRGDVSQENITLVLTGDVFGDGGEHIRQTLLKHDAKASFFLTGNFYANPSFEQLIRDLKNDGHYLGAHSDRHLLYADWTKRDSLLVTAQEFKQDLMANYERMATFGITESDAPYFLPPYEWYNREIARWTKELGFQLINFSPGTNSAADYTYPEMGDRYRTSDAIYQSIMNYEETHLNGLNGFILLIHIGTDPRRTDKFYNKLDALLTDLKARGYHFTSVATVLGQ